MPVGKGYARKSKATRYAGGYLLRVNYKKWLCPITQLIFDGKIL